MYETKEEFNKRVVEINIYFNLLTTIDKGSCHIHCNSIDGSVINESIDSELIKILKANGFLLLYNLIEATISKSIEAIFLTISSEGLKYHELSDNLKKIWINQKALPLKAGIDALTYRNIKQMLEEVANSIVANQILQLELESLRISGNIDAKEIRKIADKIGFMYSNNGSSLETIKDKRNHLAHGQFTFGDIGKDFSVNDMIELKKSTHDYLSDVLKNIENYLSERKFLKV